MYCLHSSDLFVIQSYVSIPPHDDDEEPQHEATHHLPRSHAHGLDRELPSAHVEQVLETRPKQVDDEDIMEPFLPEVVYLGYPRCCPSPTHTGNIDVVVRRMQN